MSALSDAAPIRLPWMAEAMARIARDADVQAAAGRVPTGIADARFSTAPWQMVAAAADGQPIAVAAESGQRLAVVSGAPASGLATPILMRAMANALATIPDLQSAEVVQIADEVLRVWSRPASPPATPRIITVDEDDRRWFWLAALGLLAIEMWIRRARPDVADEDARVSRHRSEDSRVA
jgi:hypothetical protein